MTVQQIVAIALGHHHAGRLPEAERIYRHILAQVPDEHNVLHLLGVLLGQRGQLTEAISLIQRAVALAPNQPMYHCNLGKFLTDVSRDAEALTTLQHAVALAPTLPEALNNLGTVQKKLGHLTDAAASFHRALELRPAYAEVHNNLGNLHKQLGRLDDAVASFQRALALRPNYADALSNLAITLTAQGRYDDAITACRSALALNPASVEAHSNLANALRECRRYDDSLAAYKAALALRPDNPTAHSNLLLGLNYHPAATRQRFFDEAKAWARLHADSLAPTRPPAITDRSPNRRLKIGYVSADFRTHASAHFLIPLLAHHDKVQFEIFCYAHISNPDALTARFQALADHWRPTLGLSDAALADQIRADQIDILIDLKAHTGEHRLLTFARQPAPLQLTWLGYPGTTGLSTIHYRLTDPHLDPPDDPATDACSSEKLYRLPDTFWCYDPLNDTLQPNTLPALTNGHITFGSLNNFCKMNDAVLTLWAKVLQRIPTARLHLLAVEGQLRQPARALFAAHGIAADRITFLTPRPRPRYLELYHDIDIALDTFPCNGHTTSLDALWMGLPVVTRVGATAMGRAGLSQLTNLNLPDLIATDDSQYVNICESLANDLPRLAALRHSLRPRMEASPLMNAPRFTQNVEAAYRTLWQRAASPTS